MLPSVGEREYFHIPHPQFTHMYLFCHFWRKCVLRLHVKTPGAAASFIQRHCTTHLMYVCSNRTFYTQNTTATGVRCLSVNVICLSFTWWASQNGGSVCCGEIRNKKLKLTRQHCLLISPARRDTSRTMTLLCYSHFVLFVTLVVDFLSLVLANIPSNSYRSGVILRPPIRDHTVRENAGYKLPGFLLIRNGKKKHPSWISKRTSNMSAISSDLGNLKSNFHAIASGVFNNLAKRQHHLGPMELYWCLV